MNRIKGITPYIMFRRLCAIFFLTVFQAANASDESNRIEWEVVNRFPLFSEQAFVRLAGPAWSFIAKPGDGLWTISPRAEASMTVNSQPSTGAQRMPFWHRASALLPRREETLWDERTQTYERKKLLSKEHYVIARLTGDKVPPTVQCLWQMSGQPTKTVAPCHASPKYKVVEDQPYIIEASDLDGVKIGSVEVQVTSTLIVTLGDSYASGEGNPDRPAILNYKNFEGFAGGADIAFLLEPGRGRIIKDADWLSPLCHRSILSWGNLAALRVAMVARHSVVKYASFACSGAEIFDGGLIAQKAPPGMEHSTARLTNHSIVLANAGEADRTLDVLGLKKSQLQQLVEFLCDKDTSQISSGMEVRNVEGVTEARRAEDNYPAPVCNGTLEQPTHLWMLFGGNDTGFLQVIFSNLEPQPLRYRLPMLGAIANEVLRASLAPLEPKKAAKYATEKLPALYTNLQAALARSNIQTRPRLGFYPNALGVKSSAPELSSMLDQCNRRSADGFAVFQKVVGRRAGNDAARFGIRPDRAAQTLESYIPALRAAQEKFVRENNWLFFDLNDSMLFEFSGLPSENGRGGLCAFSCNMTKDELETKPAKCLDKVSAGESIRWRWKPTGVSDLDSKRGMIVHAPEYPPVLPLNRFDPYAVDRLRGFRFSTDSLLTMATRKLNRSKSRRTADLAEVGSLSGTLHPTAHFHAFAADALLAKICRDSSDPNLEAKVAPLPTYFCTAVEGPK